MSSSADVLSVPALPWRPKYNPWLIAVVVAMAAFMEVLDTSIANVALPYMAGGLGASNDESTWVLTSYLVSSAVVLPISGWLAGLFGRKRFFLICIFLFTITAVLNRTGLSWGLLKASALGVGKRKVESEVSFFVNGPGCPNHAKARASC
jgi:DHA2 family multidrug resistance protein